DTYLQGSRRRVRLSGLHLRQTVLSDLRKSSYRPVAVEEEHPAHGRKDPCADRSENGVARDHGTGGQVEPHAARLGELLQCGDRQPRLSYARYLYGNAVTSVVAQQVQA